jgi:tRNA(Ile)-lysidine synthase
LALVDTGSFSCVWDRRFEVRIAATAGEGLTLAALGEAGRRHLGQPAGLHPADAIAALPALWRGGELLAVAGISPKASVMEARSILGQRLRRPPLFPDYLSSR